FKLKTVTLLLFSTNIFEIIDNTRSVPPLLEMPSMIIFIFLPLFIIITFSFDVIKNNYSQKQNSNK
ncbi:hypothetical protein B4U13_17295, partial [Klebsiella pneumoniae]